MIKTILTASLLAATSPLAMAADGHHQDIRSEVDSSKVADFDIVAAKVKLNGRFATFRMSTAGKAGASTPLAIGNGAPGAAIWAYVWPTTLDPSAVGFGEKTGILALAATSHPDFDDTPLQDENVDGDTGNDGGQWHSHWVVLTPDDRCGPGALSVRDVPEGTSPVMPATWPGVPFYLDSPGFTPVFDGASIEVNVVLANADIHALHEAQYDGVTTALRVNANFHAPHVCVENVFDIASGDLSLPGKVH
ncbi:hypothetical protein [Cohaesibacter intestini]|uniref:hypothetical protein n=1 Tax=Cohaesibacter intestini TaxID=2211145 RepID=UPI000DE888F5|nr:hypothetical protein [Cohaesibacter intestini]